MKFGRRHVGIFTGRTSILIITSLLVGIGAGLGAVLFRWLIAEFHHLFFIRISDTLGFLGHYYYILAPAIGALLFSPLIYYFAREARGHGVPEVMEAIELKGGKIRPIVAVIKSLASSICIGSGGSVGREGPIAQIGSALGSTMGQKLKFSPERIRTLVASGAAGGIAATFNAPIGGFLFASEIILRDFSASRLGGVIIASVTASFIGRVFFGNYPAFHVPSYTMKTPIELVFYFIMGLALAPISLFFTLSIYKVEDIFEKISRPELIKPILGGLLVGAIGLFYPHVFGVGYGTIEKVLFNSLALWTIILLIPLKILAVSFTLGSGGSGGIFAPSLFIGALSGSLFGHFLNVVFPGMGLEPGAYALVGMGALFAGAARAPLTAILIIFEMTNDYKIILPIMLSVIIVTVTASRLHPESIYTLKLVRRGIYLTKEIMRDLLENISVKNIYSKSFRKIPPDMKLPEIIDIFEKESPRILIVCDKNGNLHGIITIERILLLFKYEVLLEDIALAEDVLRMPPVIEEHENLKGALDKFMRTDCEILPVVRNKGDSQEVVGIISRHHLLTAYSKAVSRKRIEEKRT